MIQEQSTLNDATVATVSKQMFIQESEVMQPHVTELNSNLKCMVMTQVIYEACCTLQHDSTLTDCVPSRMAEVADSRTCNKPGLTYKDSENLLILITSQCLFTSSWYVFHRFLPSSRQSILCRA